VTLLYHTLCGSLLIVLSQQLEGELKKLQAVIQEGTQAFDEVLMALFMQKIQAELAVFQVNSQHSACFRYSFCMVDFLSIQWTTTVVYLNLNGNYLCGIVR